MISSTNKIKQLNNPYLRSKKRSIRRHRVKFNFIGVRMKHSLIVVSLSVLVILIACMNLFQTQHDLKQSHAEVRSAQVNLGKQNQKSEAYRTNIKQLKNTDYVEQLVREKYYYSKPNETIYSLPGDVSKDVTQN